MYWWRCQVHPYFWQSALRIDMIALRIKTSLENFVWYCCFSRQLNVLSGILAPGFSFTRPSSCRRFFGFHLVCILFKYQLTCSCGSYQSIGTPGRFRNKWVRFWKELQRKNALFSFLFRHDKVGEKKINITRMNHHQAHLLSIVLHYKKVIP